MYKFVISDSVYIACDTSSAPVTLYMPKITQEFMNVKFYISDGSSNAASNNITILPNGGDLINGGASIDITSNDGCCVLTTASTSDVNNIILSPQSIWIAASSQSGGGGGGNPSLPFKSIQYNNGGSFGGSSKYIFETSPIGAPANSLAIQLDSSDNSFTTQTIRSLNNGALSLANIFMQNGTGTSGIQHGVLLFNSAWTGGSPTPNTYIRNSSIYSTVLSDLGNTNAAKQLFFIASSNANSQFEWHYNTTNTLQANSRLMSLASNGRFNLAKYGINTFAGTPAYSLGVDASGNIVEFVGGGGGGLTSADNGLTANTSTNVRLGGALVTSTTITTSNSNQLTISSSTGTALNVITTGASQSAISASATSGVAAILNSSNGISLVASSDGGGLAARFQSYLALINNASVGVLKLRALTGVAPAQANFGASLEFELMTTNFATISDSNRIVSQWSDAAHATRTSKLTIKGYNLAVEGDVFVISGNGSLRLPAYGIGTFAGTPTLSLGVDASGNVVEFVGGGGGNANIQYILEAALALLETTSSLSLDTTYIVTNSSPYILQCVPFSTSLLSKTATIISNSYSGQVYYNVQTGLISNSYIFDGNQNVWNGGEVGNVLLGLNCTNNTFNQGTSTNNLGNNCDYNYFGKLSTNHTLGTNCNYNVFEDGAIGHTLGNDSEYNKFYQNSNSNTLATNCSFNIFEAGSSGNNLGDDCNNNTFEQGSNANLIGDNSIGNTFKQLTDSNTLGINCSYNIFEQNSRDNILGQSCENNTFGQNSRAFIFGDDLKNVSIDSNLTGDNYTGGGYAFMYNNAYASTIFESAGVNYHRYYEPVNDRIVITNLSTLAVSYIGAGGGGNANITTITSLALATLELAGTLDLTTLYIVNDYTYFLLMCKAQAGNKLGKNAQIVDVIYSGEVYYDVQTNSIVNGTIYDIDRNIWNSLLPVDTTFGTGCLANTFHQSSQGNVLGSDCIDNTFYQEAQNNLLGDNCSYNIFEQTASSNDLSSAGLGLCEYNKFELGASNNILGNKCTYNTFEQGASSNNLGVRCGANTFKKTTTSNTILNDCGYNVFGENSTNNSIGISGTGNILGMLCSNIVLLDNCISNTFFQEANDNSLGSSCSYNTFEQSSNTNTLGTSCSFNKFELALNSNVLGDDCYYNTFRQAANSIILGNDCQYNTFGQGVNGFTFASNLLNVTVEGTAAGLDLTPIGYAFIYGNTGPAVIRYDSGSSQWYHQYYDTTTSAFITTNL
jgi:hypothetical protein